MSKLLVVLFVGLIFEAIGVVWLNRGLKEIGELAQVTPTEILRMAGRAFRNRHIWQGIACETLFFGSLLFLMKHGDVSFVWPMTALGFVLTTLAARYLLHEQVSELRWFGVLLIVAGAAVITYTEKVKNRTSTPRPTRSQPIEDSLPTIAPKP